MRLWAVVILVLYALFIVGMIFPLGLACFYPHPSLHEYLDLLSYAATWVTIGVFVLAQALLLLVPVTSSGRVRAKKRHLLTPIMAAAAMMLILMACSAASVAAAIWGDDVDEEVFAIGGGLVMICWLFWPLMFRGYETAYSGPQSLMARIISWLIGGSIVELLVAVSCHIIVRRRGDCSAPGFTFFSIAAGVAIMFMAFGPGVLYLFAERMKKLQP